MDEIEGTDVTRRRVLLDEVLLVTYHREYGTAFVVAMLVVLTVFGAMSAFTAAVQLSAGLVVFSLSCLPALVALALRLALGLDVVTVYGRRTRATLHFWLRKSRGRETFRLVCRLARERQQRVARERARVSPPPQTPGEPGGGGE